MQEKVTILISAAAVMFFVIGGLSLLAHYYTLKVIEIMQEPKRYILQIEKGEVGS